KPAGRRRESAQTARGVCDLQFVRQKSHWYPHEIFPGQNLPAKVLIAGLSRYPDPEPGLNTIAENSSQTLSVCALFTVTPQPGRRQKHLLFQLYSWVLYLSEPAARSATGTETSARQPASAPLL